MKVFKLFLKILLLMFCILMLVLFIGFKQYESRRYEPTFFDLYITQLYYNFGNDDIDYHTGIPIHDTFSIWGTNVNKVRPIKWIYDISDFKKLDSISIGFENISKEKMYYMTWGSPMSRTRIGYIKYFNGKSYPIGFGGFGCGTGIYLTPLENNCSAKATWINPLIFDPISNNVLPVNNVNFPEIFKFVYGDSISIYFSQATYSSPWNKYKSHMIYSDSIMVNTQDIINNWIEDKKIYEFEVDYMNAHSKDEDKYKDLMQNMETYYYIK